MIRIAILGCMGLVFSCFSEPLRIMPVGDSITAGHTDARTWRVPFNFGYRSDLYQRLKTAGMNAQFVGTSQEPWNKRYADSSQGGTVSPIFDLRPLGQDGHEGDGGWTIGKISNIIEDRIAINSPVMILLMIGINGICTNSPAQLDRLVNKMLKKNPDAHLIVSQITPKIEYSEHLYQYNTYIQETLVPKYQTAGCKISTVDMYSMYLTDPQDPASINLAMFSNRINHPSTETYDAMAQIWFEEVARLFCTANR